jgi:peroxiredoxin 2/4
MVKVGQKAPAFSLAGHNTDKPVSLESLKGKWVVLFFYPLDFTPVCGTEVAAFSKHYSEFKERNTEVLSVSIDSVYTHRAWAEKIGDVKFTLLSDMNKETGREYGVLLEDKGFHLRGTFIIDPEGVVQHMQVNNAPYGRSVQEALRLLQAFQVGGPTPCDWQPGDKTL